MILDMGRMQEAEEARAKADAGLDETIPDLTERKMRCAAAHAQDYID